MSNDAPIGMFDSGIGGLTIAKAFLERLPRESLRYVGDTAHMPYGDKSPERLKGIRYRNCITSDRSRLQGACHRVQFGLQQCAG